MRISVNKTLHASAAETASLDTKNTPINVQGYGEANFYLNVTAASGTSPTLDIDIITQDPESGEWFTLTSFTQATAVTSEYKIISSNLGYAIAMDATIAGTTPSFTFSLSAVLKE